jgi:hypothetical protein
MHEVASRDLTIAPATLRPVSSPTVPLKLFALPLRGTERDEHQRDGCEQRVDAGQSQKMRSSSKPSRCTGSLSTLHLAEAPPGVIASTVGRPSVRYRVPCNRALSCTRLPGVAALKQLLLRPQVRARRFEERRAALTVDQRLTDYLEQPLICADSASTSASDG